MAIAGQQQNVSVKLFLSSKAASVHNESSLHIVCSGFPDNSSFTSGYISDNTLYLTEDDFGDVFFIPPRDFDGNFTLDVMAVVMTDNNTRNAIRLASVPIVMNHPVSEEDIIVYKRTFVRKYMLLDKVTDHP